VQIAPLTLPLHRQEILRADLVRQDARDPLDDAVADGVAERVVVPLEAVDVDDADAAPAHALLDGEERLDALHEPVEVEQLRLRIAVRLVGQLGDHFLEVARDVRDGDVLLGELPLQPLHLGGEPFRHRADGVVLRFFDELALGRDHFVDALQEFRGDRGIEVQAFDDPFAQAGRRGQLRVVAGGSGADLGHAGRTNIKRRAAAKHGA